MEEKIDVLFSKFMDSVLDLAEELHEREEPLTENEATFLNTFDEYIDEILLLDEKEIN